MPPQPSTLEVWAAACTGNRCIYQTCLHSQSERLENVGEHFCLEVQIYCSPKVRVVQMSAVFAIKMREVPFNGSELLSTHFSNWEWSKQRLDKYLVCFVLFCLLLFTFILRIYFMYLFYIGVSPNVGGPVPIMVFFLKQSNIMSHNIVLNQNYSHEK